jgi:hypothetical protein
MVVLIRMRKRLRTLTINTETLAAFDWTDVPSGVVNFMWASLLCTTRESG